MKQWIDRSWHLLFSSKRIKTVETRTIIQYNDVMYIEGEKFLYRYLGKGKWLKTKNKIRRWQ